MENIYLLIIFYLKAIVTIFDAVRRSKIEDLEALVKQGASINQVEKSRDKFTPVHTAAFYGSLEVEKFRLINIDK